MYRRYLCRNRNNLSSYLLLLCEIGTNYAHHDSNLYRNRNMMNSNLYRNRNMMKMLWTQICTEIGTWWTQICTEIGTWWRCYELKFVPKSEYDEAVMNSNLYRFGRMMNSNLYRFGWMMNSNLCRNRNMMNSNLYRFVWIIIVNLYRNRNMMNSNLCRFGWNYACCPLSWYRNRNMMNSNLCRFGWNYACCPLSWYRNRNIMNSNLYRNRNMMKVWCLRFGCDLGESWTRICAEIGTWWRFDVCVLVAIWVNHEHIVNSNLCRNGCVITVF